MKELFRPAALLRALLCAVTGALLVPAVPFAADDPPAPAMTVTAPAQPAQPATPAPEPAPSVALNKDAGPDLDARHASAAKASPAASKPKPQPAVHAAGANAVSIKNFAFSPTPISVKVGDTVTWTNFDSAPHTATGSGFNTGVLKRGQSGSHTFTSPGRVSYICSIHPNMKATVVVSAATAGGSSAAGSSPSSATPSSASPAAAAGAAPTLPRTGIQVIAIVLAGFFTGGCGLLLRRFA
jgi:LPXTG-motif cell wall-anchored protein